MILVFKNFLSLNECQELNNWVDIGIKNNWLDIGMSKGIGNGYKNRKTTRPYSERFDYSNDVYKTQQKICDFLKIQDLPKSVAGGGKDGIVVNCIFNNGDVFKHIDPKENNLEILRCNIMTRCSENGGELFVGSNKINIHVGDLHCYLPSTIEHYVSQVKGKTSRVLWMFGYQCSIERFKQLCQRQQQI